MKYKKDLPIKELNKNLEYLIHKLQDIEDEIRKTQRYLEEYEE